MEKERIEDRILQITAAGINIVGLGASGTLYELVATQTDDTERMTYTWRAMLPSPVWLKKKPTLTPNDNPNEQPSDSGSIPQGPKQAADGDTESGN